MNIFELMGTGFATVCTPAGFALMFVGVAVGRTMTQGRLAVKAILENA